MGYFFVPTSGHTDLELVSTSVWLTIKKQEITWQMTLWKRDCVPVYVHTYLQMCAHTFACMSLHTYPWVSIPTYPCMCLLTYAYWCMIWKINGLTLAFWLFILLDQKNDVSRIRARICGVGRRTTCAHPRPKFIQTSNASSSRRTIFPLNFWQQVCTLSILKCHQKSLQQAL